MALIVENFTQGAIDAREKLNGMDPPKHTRPVRLQLNRNESAYEFPEKAKRTILNKLAEQQWKNYPSPYNEEVESLLATYCQVPKDMIIASAGSATIIASLLNFYAIRKRQIVIARPSFALYEAHCKAYGIDYEVWALNDQLEYDLNKLPRLAPYSIVMFTSPNNPVGNVISSKDLELMLQYNPFTFFLLDEVYCEYAGRTFIPLLNKYPNLLLLRSFSKTFSAAGIRLGYLIGHKDVIQNIRKIMVPYSLNHLSTIFTKFVLNDPETLEINRKYIKNTVIERSRVYKELHQLSSLTDMFKVLPSKGNFLCIIFKNLTTLKYFTDNLFQSKIDVLELNNIPGLQNAIRLTIGSTGDNDFVLEKFKEFVFKPAIKIKR